MAELFLTDEEMIRLTGRKARRLQAEQLRKMGVPFYLNAANIPIVARASPSKGTQPRRRNLSRYGSST